MRAAGPASLVKDINLAPDPFASSGFGSPMLVGDTLYFVATDASNGSELWRSDGTPAGTALIKDILPGTESPFCGMYDASW